jgi:hypothetical protein
VSLSPALVADAILVGHALFILFAALGAVAVLRWAWLAALHLPALAWAIFIELSHGICPLTPLEVHWRERAGEAGYEGGFVQHYVYDLIYPAGLTPTHQVLIAALLATVNLALYALIVARWRARRAARMAALVPTPSAR